MRAKWNGRIGAILLVCLAGAGCREPTPEPTPLGAEMEREMRLALPTVGGPTQELSVGKDPADIVAPVEATLKESGIRVIQTGSSNVSRWLLGRSLADRRVLVQILPVYPGRSTVKVTVEGADSLTNDLLRHVISAIERRVR